MFEAKTPNYGERRPVMIVLHGTEVNDALARPIFEGKTPAQGSCHYYIDASGQLTQYLDETQRAWHAGMAYWAGFTDINSMSIGIELEAISHSRKFDGDETVYTKAQMDVLIPLLRDIQNRHNIAPWNIVAHQDISCTRPFDPEPAETLEEILATQPVAQQRKYDPGVHFNWRLLAENGIGLWHDLPENADDTKLDDIDAIKLLYHHLALYGYDMRNAGLDAGHEHVIRAFQTHFLPWILSKRGVDGISGKPSVQTARAAEILARLKTS